MIDFITKPIKNIKTLSDAYLLSFIILTLMFLIEIALARLTPETTYGRYLIPYITLLVTPIPIIYFVSTRNLGDSINTKTCFLMPVKTMLVAIFLFSIPNITQSFAGYITSNSIDCMDIIAPIGINADVFAISILFVGAWGFIGKKAHEPTKFLSVYFIICLIILFLTFRGVFSHFQNLL